MASVSSPAVRNTKHLKCFVLSFPETVSMSLHYTPEIVLIKALLTSCLCRMIITDPVSLLLN